MAPGNTVAQTSKSAFVNDDTIEGVERNIQLVGIYIRRSGVSAERRKLVLRKMAALFRDAATRVIAAS